MSVVQVLATVASNVLLLSSFSGCAVCRRKMANVAEGSRHRGLSLRCLECCGHAPSRCDSELSALEHFTG
jgi:hypothetical protein